MAKILTIDDEENNLRLLRLELEDEGHEIIEAMDGVQGWEQLESHGDSIDLILLDRMMPNMDGMAFMKKIKVHDVYNKIPVIMQTAAAEKTQVAEGIRAGVYYYLTKPYEEEVLISVVNAALQNYADQSGLREALKTHKACFGMTTQSEWEFRTFDECNKMAPFVASYFPDPERVVMGISELFVNAVEHGNLGISYDEKTELNNKGTWEKEILKRLDMPEYSDRKVRVTYERQSDAVVLTITDEGEGFKWDDYLEISPSRATHSHGRGIAMSKMMSFDEMEYQGTGNQVICKVFIEE